MKYLIFRTDRIGDFLITLPLLKSIKRNFNNSEISVVVSPKNIDFVKKNILVDKVFLLKSNKLIDKIKLFMELKKYSYEAIVVADKKNRSIFLSLFLDAKKKIFNVSKYFQKIFLNIFYNNISLDNDMLKNLPVKEILKINCKMLNINLIDDDYIFFDVNQFKKKFYLDNILDLEKLEYIVFHYDEKWELDNYSKLFKKAKNLTDINISKKSFSNFLYKLSEKKSMSLILTTGYLDTNLINEIKKDSKKIETSLYELNFKNKKIYLITDQNFFSMSHLISKSNLFISCHGAFTHIASNFNIKILDIIEKSKKTHYSRITHHMKDYKAIYRKNSSELFSEIINFS